MNRTKTAVRLWRKIKSYPKEYTIPSAVLLVIAILYGVVFFIEKPVVFSYAGDTCAKQLTLFPDLHKVTGEDGYKLYQSKPIQIGDLTLATRETCFTPTKPPRPGTAKMRLSPLGGLLFRKTFVVKVDSLPVVQTDVFDKPLPVSRTLHVPLSTADETFTYRMKIGGKSVECMSKNKATACDVEELKLLQGKPYALELTREFNGKKVATVAKEKITTLSATSVIKSSVKPGETVYAKPRKIELAFDKNVVKADATLYRAKGGKRTVVKTKLVINGKKIQLTTAKDLPRSAAYELHIKSVEATDGSGLEKPYKLAFKTSGGPRVTGVNVGRTGVAMGSTVVITFDQPLSKKQDISKIVTLGGGAVLSGKTNNQLFVSLAGVPRCGDFSIKLMNDLQSNYGIAGNSAWSFTGRTVCHTIGTIGYSGSGRAINAYFFGSGPATVLYTGAIHGNEISTKYLMDVWIDELEVNARRIPASKSVVVVPQINPDGVSSGSRTNARNVDLNRNFSTGDWRKDITTVNNQPFPGGGGKSPMSEPETQAIASLAQRLHPVLILSYHSVGGVVAANQAGSSGALAGTYSQLSGYLNVTGRTSETFEYSVSGTADDWYAQKLGVASILVELGSSSYHQFGRNQDAMWAMLNNS